MIDMQMGGQRQHTKIKADPVLSTGIVEITTPSAGGAQRTIMLPKIMADPVLSSTVSMIDMVAQDGKRGNPNRAINTNANTSLTTFTWLLPEGFTRDPQHNNAFDIRVVTIDGNPWFVAVDACRALGLSNPTVAIRPLDAGEWTKMNLGQRGFGAVNMISESGLYKLIMRSDKPQAKPFQDWVTKVVLPAIRKTVLISEKEKLTPNQILGKGVGPYVCRALGLDMSRGAFKHVQGLNADQKITTIGSDYPSDLCRGCPVALKALLRNGIWRIFLTLRPIWNKERSAHSFLGGGAHMALQGDTRRLWRPSWAAWVALCSHLIWAILFLYAFVAKRGPVQDGALPICKTCEDASDAVAVAAELGRLDFVALSLTFLGVVLALASVAGYFMLRHSAMKAASEEAHARVADLAPAAIKDYMNQGGVKVIAEVLQNNPSLLLKGFASARDVDQLVDRVSPEDADEIANSFDGE